ncbi:2OG-Fe(II) oxygenase [Maricaulis salignorans]|uniref:SM-20-related protein n=1 Tax=Maricaulis salignorans TaxID=144026 RepID=A0A1G9NXY3_9PROT|nr:2OG-Fe(II) oxygenase [Maricaulis salignorans]SDL91231.1 SM-20-related protein [Maricaulis salignorans]
MGLHTILPSGLPAFDAAGLCADLTRQGWSQQSLGDTALLTALREEAVMLWQEDELRRAGVGRASDHELVREIRRDKTRWFDGSSPAQRGWLDFAESLRLQLNQRLALGLFSFEAHYAVYEPGGFYRKHLDSFRGARNRILSSVLYLNPGWQAGDGGLLRLYDESDDSVITDIIPEFGTFAVFLSEEIPHEVTPALAPRFSIAGWHRCNDLARAPALQAKVLPIAAI